MTEDEAKTKWCPMARAGSPSITRNRSEFGNADGRCLCLASGCMMWRATGVNAGHCGLAGSVNGTWTS